MSRRSQLPLGKSPSQRGNRKSSRHEPSSKHGKGKRSKYISGESLESGDLRATAYHEAGHAVAAIVFDLGLVSVDIKGHSALEADDLLGLTTMGKYLGFTCYTSGDGQKERTRRMLEDPDWCWRQMLVMSAGPSAEAAVLRDEGTQDGYQDDNNEILNMARAACCKGTLRPDGKISISAADIRREESTILAMLSRCFARIEEFLRDYWPAIKAVAQLLIDRKSLTGDEVKRIVKSSIKTTDAIQIGV